MPYQDMMAEEAVPKELLAAMMAEHGVAAPDLPDEDQASTADAFVEFAHQDNTAQEADPNTQIEEAPGIEDKKPAWSGNASLDGGDAGTRNYEMGLPQASSV